MSQENVRKSSIDDERPTGVDSKNESDSSDRRKKLRSKLSEVEKKARERDLKNQGMKDFGINNNDINPDDFNRIIKALNEAGYGIYKPKDKRLKFKFVQMNQTNWDYVLKEGLLTTEEIKFLNQLIPKIGFNSNCVIKAINTKVQVPMSQKDIADALKTTPNKVSRLVNNLRKKGFLAKSDVPNHDEGEILKGRSHAIYFNPNIFLSGDKTNINESLITMFNNPPEALRKLPEQLFELQPVKENPKEKP